MEVAADNVNAIEVGSDIDIRYTQSPETSVRVEAPDNIIDIIEVEVEDGTLTARMKPNNYTLNGTKTTVYVTSPGLKSIESSSSSTVEIPRGLKVMSDFEVSASSSSTVAIAGLEAANVEIGGSSSTTIEISSLKAANVEISASSSADVTVKGLVADKVDVGGSSSTAIELYDMDVAKIISEATSSAEIVMTGRCEYVDMSATSSATITAGKLLAKRGRAETSSAGEIECNIEDLQVVDAKVENFAR